MRICCVIPSFYPAVVYGGWVFSSWNAYKAFSKLGIDTFVSTTNDNGNAVLQSSSKTYIKIEDNIYVKYYPQTIRERFSMSLLFNLWRDIYNSELVRIHGIFSISTPIGLFYSFILGKKVLLSPHGCLGTWCLADGNRLKKYYLYLLIRPFANNIIWHATSNQEANEIKTLYPNARIEVIPNGINLSDFGCINLYSKSDFVKKYAGIQRETDHVIISMGRLHKKKGFDILIRAFQKSLRAYPNTTLLIAGENFGEEGKLKKLIQDFGLENRAFIIGHLSGQDRIDFLANADVFVLPSHNENFGMVYAEAMAAGTPVIASKGTPWSDVERLKIGRWVNNDDTSTSDAIVDMLGKDTKIMGANSKEFITQQYTWEGISRKFNILFNEMLLVKKPKGRVIS